MTDKELLHEKQEIIATLTLNNMHLKDENDKLYTIIGRIVDVMEKFAEKDINIKVVTNSYNGAYADNNSKTTSKADADSSNNADTKGANITMGEENTIA